MAKVYKNKNIKIDGNQAKAVSKLVNGLANIHNNFKTTNFGNPFCDSYRVEHCAVERQGTTFIVFGLSDNDIRVLLKICDELKSKL